MFAGEVKSLPITCYLIAASPSQLSMKSVSIATVTTSHLILPECVMPPKNLLPFLVWFAVVLICESKHGISTQIVSGFSSEFPNFGAGCKA